MGYVCIGLFLIIFGALMWGGTEFLFDTADPQVVGGLATMAVGATVMLLGMVAHVVSEDRAFRAQQQRR